MRVWILADYCGDDRYSGEYCVQGFAQFGVGMLIDGAGNDRYSLYTLGQGCALTLGFGLLLDLEGNDSYLADDADIRYPSEQSDLHNESMAQGSSSGERRDYIDNKSLAGGVGTLIDLRGDDEYSGGVFCQASAYWFGIGILDDSSGNDKYFSAWYGQAGQRTARLRYFVREAATTFTIRNFFFVLAAANDFSVSIFLEEAGDDIYDGASTCGFAIDNSLAIFMDAFGVDRYKNGVFGKAEMQTPSKRRIKFPTIGLFFDLAEQDIYETNAFLGSASRTRQKNEGFSNLLGLGFDIYRKR